MTRGTRGRMTKEVPAGMTREMYAEMTEAVPAGRLICVIPEGRWLRGSGIFQAKGHRRITWLRSRPTARTPAGVTKEVPAGMTEEAQAPAFQASTYRLREMRLQCSQQCLIDRHAKFVGVCVTGGLVVTLPLNEGPLSDRHWQDSDTAHVADNVRCL